MSPEDRDLAYFWDMLDAAQAITRFLEGKRLNDYLSDRMLRNAVERNMEIIGEAARRVSEQGRLAYPELPWSSMIGQRNVLAHEYDQILHEILWKVARDRIPELISALSVILPNDD